jgi:hypothetical protein
LFFAVASKATAVDAKSDSADAAARVLVNIFAKEK